jgi:hypothetical protein
MGKSAPSAPAAPDPVATANAQSAANVDTAVAQALLNNTNQITPYGNLTFNQTGTQQVNGKDVPQFTSTTSLTPQAQQAVDSQQALTQQLYDLAQNKFGQVQSATSGDYNYDNLPQIPGSADLNANRDTVTDALYGQATSRLDPMYNRQQDQINSDLASRGIVEGSDAYNQAQSQFGLTRNDAYNSALNQAIAAGGQEQSRLFGLGQANRNQAIQEQASIRSQPINEIGALLGTGQVQNPQFSNMTQTSVAPTDVIGANSLAYQGQLANFQAQQQARNATMGGLFGLGGSALMAGAMPGGFLGLGSAAAPVALASDIRVKTDIKRVGKTDDGLPIYTYRYKWGGPVQMGVMAQEVEQVKPWAVTEIDGIKHVYYGEI